MATKPETLMYNRLREHLPGCNITRIESTASLGIPDCLIAFKDYGFVMVELKVVKSGKKVKFSPHQIAFQIKHAAMGVPAFVLVQYHPPRVTGLAGARWYLYKCDQVEQLYREGLIVRPHWWSGASVIDWVDLGYQFKYQLTGKSDLK